MMDAVLRSGKLHPFADGGLGFERCKDSLVNMIDFTTSTAHEQEQM